MDTEPSIPPRICSKSKCKNVLLHDDTRKTCERCREYDRVNTAARRKRKQESQPEDLDSGRPAPLPPTSAAVTIENDTQNPNPVESDSSEVNSVL